VKVGAGRQFHLTYCLNIHPGETWADQRDAIERLATAVKSMVAPNCVFGLGLRLSRRAADDMSDSRLRKEVRKWLGELGCYAFTVNAFPYGVFHGRAVKEAVYAPDWRAPERLDYTARVAEILADLLPDGVEGSISTVPGSYRTWIGGESDERAIARNLADAAWALDGIERKTGKMIALAVEPEPDCLLETTGDCVRFWSEVLIPAGIERLRERSCSSKRAEACLRRHLGVCVDTCHFAIQFESPETAVASLAAAGIAVPKVQLSAALSGPVTADVVRRLGAFVDNVYLHQTRIRRGDSSVERWTDLTADRLALLRPDADSEIRSHFHVPLHFAFTDSLGSTVGDLTPQLLEVAARAGCRHLEIETYTYDVLPEHLRSTTFVDSIGREYKAALGRLGVDG
jgi:hypothetical protein